MSNIRRIVIYTRISTDSQPNPSHAQQESLVRERLEKQGIDPSRAVVTRDNEIPGISGRAAHEVFDRAPDIVAAADSLTISGDAEIFNAFVKRLADLGSTVMTFGDDEAAT